MIELQKSWQVYKQQTFNDIVSDETMNMLRLLAPNAGRKFVPNDYHMCVLRIALRRMMVDSLIGLLGGNESLVRVLFSYVATMIYRRSVLKCIVWS